MKQDKISDIAPISFFMHENTRYHETIVIFSV